jgi:hypothetical protein
VPPETILVGVKVLVTVGGVNTFTVAVFDTAPVSVTGPVAPTAVVVLFLAPAVVPVTVTLITQFALAANVPPVNVNRFVPLTTKLPPHVAVVPFTAVNPAGSVSVKLSPDSAVPVFGFVTVMFITDVPPTAMLGVTKALLMVGADNTVNTTPVAAVPVKDTGPVAAGAVVAFVLVLVALTLCVIVQVPPGTMVPAVNPTLVPAFTPPLSVALPAPLHTTPPAALFTNVPV